MSTDADAPPLAAPRPRPPHPVPGRFRLGAAVMALLGVAILAYSRHLFGLSASLPATYAPVARWFEQSAWQFALLGWAGVAAAVALWRGRRWGVYLWVGALAAIIISDRLRGPMPRAVPDLRPQQERARVGTPDGAR